MSPRPVILRSALLAAAASALLATSACGGGSTATPAAAAPRAAAPATHDMNGMPMSGDMGGMQMGNGGTELWAVQTGPLGVIVTDGTGHMLYRSDADRADPPAANCTGSCAATWVPLRITDSQPPDLEGVDQAKVGTVARSDGAPQITLAGWPLYWHQGEPLGLATSGSNGQGGWFVTTPTGAKAPG